MITKDNLNEVITSLSNKDKKRILSSKKEYTVLYLNIFNAGYIVTARLTNDYNRYKNVSKDGDAIFNTEEVQNLITENLYYNIDCVPYRVFNQTKQKLIIENFLKIGNLWGENEFFTVDITDNVLTLTLWDNNKYSFEENIDYLTTYFNDIGTKIFNYRTLQAN